MLGVGLVLWMIVRLGNLWEDKAGVTRGFEKTINSESRGFWWVDWEGWARVEKGFGY